MTEGKTRCMSGRACHGVVAPRKMRRRRRPSHTPLLSHPAPLQAAHAALGRRLHCTAQLDCAPCLIACSLLLCPAQHFEGGSLSSPPAQPRPCACCQQRCCCALQLLEQVSPCFGSTGVCEHCTARLPLLLPAAAGMLKDCVEQYHPQAASVLEAALVPGLCVLRASPAAHTARIHKHDPHCRASGPRLSGALFGSSKDVRQRYVLVSGAAAHRLEFLALPHRASCKWLRQWGQTSDTSLFSPCSTWRSSPSLQQASCRPSLMLS